MADCPRPYPSENGDLLLMLRPEDGVQDVDVYREQVEHTQVTGGCRCGGSRGPKA